MPDPTPAPAHEPPPRIVIAGAGAIGTALAARLAGAGLPVTLVARGAERLAALRAGVVCQEAAGRIEAAPTIAERIPVEACDVLFLAVKAGQIADLVRGLPLGEGRGPLIVPLVNGIPWWLRLGGDQADRPIRAVDPDGALLARFRPGQLVGAVVYTTAMLTGPAQVRVMDRQRLVLGAVVPGAEVEARLSALVAVLQAAGVDTLLSRNIRDDVWTKVALNMATNPLSVVTEAALGDICAHDDLLPLVSSMLDEVWRVAARHDARPSITRSEMIARGRRAGEFRTSMLEDWRKGRPIELGAIADAVLELGADMHVDLPVSRAIAHLARYRAA
jgi:2-dehydropantoate 2-reductase